MNEMKVKYKIVRGIFKAGYLVGRSSVYIKTAKKFIEKLRG